MAKFLTLPALGKVAYANPKLAPYGAAAVEGDGQTGADRCTIAKAGTGREHWPDLHVCFSVEMQI